MRKQKSSRWTMFRKELENLAREQGIEVRYAINLASEGGACKLHGRPLVLLNSRAADIKKAKILAEALKKQTYSPNRAANLTDASVGGIDAVFIRPELREFIESGIMPRRRAVGSRRRVSARSNKNNMSETPIVPNKRRDA